MKRIESKKVRQSAKGEECQVNGPTCNYNTETTVFAHLPFDSGMGIKPTDLSGCYACSNCHDLIDRRTANWEFNNNREWYLRRAQTRTWNRLMEKGILILKA